ncbi:hypothetical protein [Citricoccus nitrophenolicus]|uniref:hypothetical protein n=1 Tax=Citricoccus nitrophenolicus TaxID=863575 RepID=UPI0039B502D8
MLNSPVQATNDLQELLRIHFHLFQDVFDWAGQLRTVDARKDVHPFREGNGRTQRIFWNRVALKAGWQLDWRPVHGEENHLAARAGSDQQDLAPLVRMFEKVITVPASIGTDDWAREEIDRLSIRPPASP